MPHNSTTIYRNTSVTPNLGISIEDIRAVLGSSSCDIGTLVVNGSINKWAKYKPVRSSNPGILTVSDRKAAQQGFSTEVADATGVPTTSGSFFYKLLAGSLPWEYVKPRGYSSNEWFRFLDFDGYDIRATVPVEPFAFSSIMLTYDNELVLQWELAPRESYELAIEDLRIDGTDIENWYFGALLYHQTSGQYAFVAPTTIGSGSLSVTFSGMSSWAGRTVKMVPFLSKVQLSRDTAVGNGRYISLLGFTPVDLTISRPSSGVYVNFSENVWNQAGTQINYQIDVENTTASPKSGLTVYIGLVKGSDPNTGETVSSRTINNFSVNGNSTVSITGSFTGLTKNQSDIYWVTISTPGDTTIPFQAMPIEDPEEMEE